jgi:serine/threonine protein kinase
MTMTEPHDYASIKSLFLELHEADAAEREARLAALDREQPERAAALRRLLAASGTPLASLDQAEHEPAAAEFPRYRCLRELGRGGMGRVWLAERSDGAFVQRSALKQLDRERWSDAERERFVRERQILAELDHRNIANLVDGGSDSRGAPFLVTAYIDGPRIDDYCERRGLDLRARVALVRDLADAIAFAHRRLVVHRDIKPANVLVDGDGVAKLLDFGIAKLLGEHGTTTADGGSLMTLRYAAPEQVRGERVGVGCDIYALGVLLYEMLCGRVPHRGESMVRTLAMQMLDPIEPPSKVRPDLAIPPALEAVLMHALIKKRELRYQTMGELLDALDSILPPPIGQSVTGSPIYTLAALPPGADPHIVPSTPARPLQSSEAVAPAPPPAPAGTFTPPRAAVAAVDPSSSPLPVTRRPRDEPEFTADDRPVSFDHVFTEEMVQIRRRRWPLLVLFAMIFGGATGAVALVLKSRSSVIDGVIPDAEDIAIADAGQEPADAEVVVVAPPDAAEVIVPDVTPVDAGQVVAIQHDAARPGPVAPPGPHDAAPVVVTPNRRGTVQVQVLTKPEGATLHEGSLYRGPGGAQLEEPFGTQLTITCKQTGYKPGIVEVPFDGSTEAVLCVLKRIRVCIDDIKNPFDDCEEAPAKGP